MPKGWKLVSLYAESHYPGHEGDIYVDFAHYTGRRSAHGGDDYDKTLSGHISPDDLRKVLRRRLTLEKRERR